MSFNNKGSATAQFVPKIFKTLGINVEELYLSQGDALEKLRNGEIDATICSCPAPVPAYATVKPEWGLRFVSVPWAKSIQANYLPATIRNEDYPALIGKDETVDTIAASTVLISFNWPKDTERYERTAKFVDAFFSKFSEFHKPPRNPLWKSVNLAATIPDGPALPRLMNGSKIGARVRPKVRRRASSSSWASEEATRHRSRQTSSSVNSKLGWASRNNKIFRRETSVLV